MYTRAQLREKLAQKGYDESTAAEVLAWADEGGLLSDAEYSAAFARLKWNQSRWGAHRVRQALRAKGVESADIDAAFRQVYPGGWQGAPGGGNWAGSEGDEEAEEEAEEEARMERQLLRSAENEWARSAGKPRDTRRRRLVGWLQRRGHPWDRIRPVMDHVERQDD